MGVFFWTILGVYSTVNSFLRMSSTNLRSTTGFTPGRWRKSAGGPNDLVNYDYAIIYFSSLPPSVPPTERLSLSTFTSIVK